MGEAEYVLSISFLHGPCSLKEALTVLGELGVRVSEVLSNRRIVFSSSLPVEELAERLFYLSSAVALYRLAGGIRRLYGLGRVHIEFEGVRGEEKASLIEELREKGVFLSEKGVRVLLLKRGDRISVYEAVVEYRRDRFKPRSPEKRVFFQSSALNPPTALLLLNIARGFGKRVLDPFAGTGSVVIEAALSGSYSVGVEIDYRQVRGALRNLRQYGVHAYVDLVLGDSLFPPFRDGSFDAIATDPPYGRYASTKGRSVEEVYGGLLRLAKAVLKGGRAAFFSPGNVEIREEKVREECSIYVHSGLTRRLWVYDAGRRSDVWGCGGDPAEV